MRNLPRPNVHMGRELVRKSGNRSTRRKEERYNRIGGELLVGYRGATIFIDF